MPWQEVEGTKPPLKYDEEEQKDVPKKVLKTEEEKLRNELLTGQSEPEKPLIKKPNEVVFDSKVGYLNKDKKK